MLLALPVVGVHLQDAILACCSHQGVQGLKVRLCRLSVASVSIEIWSFGACHHQPCGVFPGGVFGIPGFGTLLVRIWLGCPGLRKCSCCLGVYLWGRWILEQGLIQVCHSSKLIICGMPQSFQERRLHQGLGKALTGVSLNLTKNCRITLLFYLPLCSMSGL